MGDIFHREPHPDLIIKELMKHKDIDIQCGNLDIVWMRAALGSMPLIATLIRVAASCICTKLNA
ncbi:MAG: fructose-bisphosphatase class III [Salinivirgaceae bacterium]|nr:fructose-bisphosphatase class III [Salinivirgaceae bacterium]